MLRIFLATTLLLFAAQGAEAVESVPPVPQYYVFDEPGLLNVQQKKALESILIEHDQTTGEQLIVAIFNSLDGEDAAQRTRQVFEEWQVGKRGRDNGALLAVYSQEQQWDLETGYGLQTVGDSESHPIVRDFLTPELKAGHTYRALGLGILELLRAVESPLIESGRALQLLQAGGIDGALRPVARSVGPGSWLAFVLAGALLFAGVLSHLIAAEAHFTGEGWFKPAPWLSAQVFRSARSKAPGGAGGIDGSW